MAGAVAAAVTAAPASAAALCVSAAPVSVSVSAVTAWIVKVPALLFAAIAAPEIVISCPGAKPSVRQSPAVREITFGAPSAKVNAVPAAICALTGGGASTPAAPTSVHGSLT